MANFRIERAFLRIDGFIDGFDPNEGIDPDEFARQVFADPGTYERQPLSDFTFAPFDRPLWFAAEKGLKVVRAVIKEREKELETATGKRKESLPKELSLLRAVEDRLDRIDSRDLRFYILARDLPSTRRRSRPQPIPEPPVVPKKLEKRVSPNELRQLIQKDRTLADTLAIIRENGIWRHDLDIVRQHLLLDDLAQFWADVFEVTVARFIAWREYNWDGIQRGRVQVGRCTHQNKRGQQCSLKGQIAVSPTLFWAGNSDRCKRHRRDLTRGEYGEVFRIRNAAQVAYKWPETTDEDPPSV